MGKEKQLSRVVGEKVLYKKGKDFHVGKNFARI